MQNIIDAFPLIYAIWGGILIVWGMFIGLGFFKIIKTCSAPRISIRKSDTLNLWAVAAITLGNIFSLFIKHDATQYILDTLILGHLWCTVYYSGITYTQLRCLPRMFKKVIK